jgi:hypothetical protein
VQISFAKGNRMHNQNMIISVEKQINIWRIQKEVLCLS